LTRSTPSLTVYCWLPLTFVPRRFGGSIEDYPHPELDWKGFLTVIDKHNQRTGKVFDPAKGKMRDWISRDKLAKMRTCTIS
jgi:hypothetical protein